MRWLVEVEVIAITTAEQFAYRQSRRLSENVPTRNVDAAFHVGVALQGCIHDPVEFAQLARIGAEYMGPQFAQAAAHALGIRRQVKRPKRADFAVADQARIRFDANNGAIEYRDRFSAGPFVGGFVQREFHTKCRDASDLHVQCSQGCVLAMGDSQRSLSSSKISGSASFSSARLNGKKSLTPK